MTKYRICKNGDGDYKIQTKKFIGWYDYMEHKRYDFWYVVSFASLEDAQKEVLYLTHCEQAHKRKTTWSIVESGTL